MRAVLGDHERAGEPSVCHHGEKTGTRSQTIVAVSEEGWAKNRLWYAEGFPCTAEWKESSALFG